MRSHAHAGRRLPAATDPAAAATGLRGAAVPPPASAAAIADEDRHLERQLAQRAAAAAARLARRGAARRALPAGNQARGREVPARARSRPPATSRTSPGRRPTTASRCWCAQAWARWPTSSTRPAGLRRRAEARDRRRPSAAIARRRLLRAQRPGGRLRQVPLQARLVRRRRPRSCAPSSPRHPALAVVGDFNIAPEDRDVHDPALWAGQVLCSDAERAVFRDWLALGLADGFRLFEQPPRDVQLVGLPAARLPQEPRPAHRPHPAVGAARRALHGAAASTATRARARSRPTTRR